MPYLYKVEILDSPLEGKGVFTMEDIPQGATFWIFQTNQPYPPIKGHQPQPNRAITRQQLEKLQAEGKTEDFEALFKQVTYYADQDIILDYRDGTEFTNHSENANTKGVDPQSKNHKEIKAVAKRLIKKGEEILENYNQYDDDEPEWLKDFIRKYYPERLQLYQSFNLFQKQP